MLLPTLLLLLLLLSHFIIVDNLFLFYLLRTSSFSSSSIGHASTTFSSKKNACIHTRITVPKLRYINDYALGTTWIYIPSPYCSPSTYWLSVSVSLSFPGGSIIILSSSPFTIIISLCRSWSIALAMKPRDVSFSDRRKKRQKIIVPLSNLIVDDY